MPSCSCSSKPCVSRHLPREIRARNQPTSPRWAFVDQAPPLPYSSFPIQAILAAAIGNSVVRAHYVRNSPIALIALARRSGRTSLTWILDFCPPLFAILLTPLEGPLHGSVAACSRVISCWSFTGIKCVGAGCPMSSCLFSCFLLLVRFLCCWFGS